MVGSRETNKRFQVQSTLHGIIEAHAYNMGEAKKIAVKHKKTCCKDHLVEIYDTSGSKCSLVMSI